MYRTGKINVWDSSAKIVAASEWRTFYFTKNVAFTFE